MSLNVDRQRGSIIASLTRTLIVFALCLAIGLQWFALQSVAWAGMVIKYSRNAPLSQALAQTFDGEHPCDLCKGIASAQHSQKKQDAQPRSSKCDFFLPTRTLVLTPPTIFWQWMAPLVLFEVRADAPAIPPPRAPLG